MTDIVRFSFVAAAVAATTLPTAAQGAKLSKALADPARGGKV